MKNEKFIIHISLLTQQKRTRMKRKISILLMAMFTVVASGQVSVKQELDSVAIYIGEQTDMKVKVTLPRGKQIAWPELKERQYIAPGVEIISVTAEDSVMTDNDAKEVTRKVRITSFDESLYAIPAMTVKVDGKEYQGNTLALKVVTLDVDTLHPNQFFPPKDVQDNPFSWAEWKGLFWWSMLMVVLAAMIYYLYVRLKQNKPIISRIRIVRHVPAHQKALTAIEKIKQEKIVYSDDQKTYYTMLTDTLRQYIFERFGFNAMEMTTSQIIENLQAADDKVMLEELRELFSTADLVKFAKYSALTNENDLNLVNAIRFIDDTKIEGQPTEERIVPQITTDEKRRIADRRLTKALIAVLTVAVAAIFVYIMISLYRM